MVLLYNFYFLYYIYTLYFLEVVFFHVLKTHSINSQSCSKRLEDIGHCRHSQSTLEL